MSDPQQPQAGQDPVDDTEASGADVPTLLPGDEAVAPRSLLIEGAATEPVATIEGGAATVSPEPGEGVAGIPVADAPTAIEVVAGEPTERRRGRPKPAKPSTLTPLGAYAVVETGGKQYRVSVGDTVSVEKLVAEAGSELTFDRVLLLGGDGAVRVGTPTVSGAAVTARVEEQYRGEKIVVFKYKPKKRYRRRLGHRQSLTRLTITGITG